MDDQARLESVCSRKATVGSNPTLSATILPLYLTGKADHFCKHCSAVALKVREG
mgnify:CR=1 FL=1